MTDLFNAIYNYYLTTSLASSLSALYNTQAPENAIFPYGVMALINNAEDWTFTEEMEDCLVQIDLYSSTEDAVEVCNLFELLKMAFDFHDLSVTNYVTISLTREAANLVREEYIWHYSITYHIILGKE